MCSLIASNLTSLVGWDSICDHLPLLHTHILCCGTFLFHLEQSALRKAAQHGAWHSQRMCVFLLQCGSASSIIDVATSYPKDYNLLMLCCVTIN